MAKGQLWETRPLEFWSYAKELRAGWQASIEDEEKGVGQGNIMGPDGTTSVRAVTVVEDNPQGAMMSNKTPRFARESRLASEIRGWGREICGYHNNCWGAQFLGYQADGSPFPYRQFVVPFPCVCDSHGKRGQQVRDFAPVPQFMADMCFYMGDMDQRRNGPMLEHKTWCQLKILNDLERDLGQKFDDEEYYRVMKMTSQIRELAKEVSILMATTIPAPISVKDLYSVYTLGGLTKINPDDTLKFWTMVRDEIKWRAENHIAAVGNERFRWIEAHPPSWHMLKYYRYMEKYGAVCLGSQYSHIMSGGLRLNPDGTIRGEGETGCRGVDPYPADMPLETREDLVRYGFGPDARVPYTFKLDEYMDHNAIVDFAKMMQADGALLGLWRCGVGCTMTRKEQAMKLREAGYKVLEYEGSQPGDRTDLDEKDFFDKLDCWMESLGLEKLTD